MKLSKAKQQLLDEAYETFIQVGMYDRPLEDLIPFIAEDIMNFGAGENELSTTKEGFIELIKNQKRLAEDLKLTYIFKPIFRKITNKGLGAIYTDDVINSIWINDVRNELRFRLSSIFEFRASKWFLVHSHASTPDSHRTEDEVWPVEELKRRTEFLEKSLEEKIAELEEKNKDLEIESALERVRTVAMSMQHPEELSGIGEIIFTELKGLGIADLRNTEVIVNDDKKECIKSYYYSDYGVTGVIDVDYNSNPILRQWFEDLKRAEDAFAEVVITKKEMEEWKSYRLSLGYVADPKLEKADQVYYYSYSTGKGALSISSFQPVLKRQMQFLKQFRNVFHLAYQRYSDITMAKAQAREAQLEASLERVRAISMGMHSSEDLGNVALSMFEQMKLLGGDLFAFGIVLCNKHEGMVEQWHGIGTEGMLSPFLVPIDLDYIHRYRYDQWNKGVELFSIEIPSDYIQEHFDLMYALPSVKAVFEDFEEKGIQIETPPWEIDYGASFKYGYLLVSALKPFEEASVFPRFARVFEQAYLRFCDLKKAEEQAREAEIQLALERIRARSMAMQRSEELKEVIQIIFDQLAHLKINAEHAEIVVDYKAKADWNFWVAETQDIPSRISVPFLDSVWDKQFTEAKEEGQEFFVTQLSFEEKNIFYKKMLPYIPGVDQKAKDFYFNCPGLAISTVIQKDIGLYIENFSGTPYSNEENEILRRFGKVFQQTHTRFLDLQKTEEQAREAQIEASLERVRARTMAMHQSSELSEAASILFQELEKLGIKTIGCGFCILNRDHNIGHLYFSVNGQVIPESIPVPQDLNARMEESYLAWLKGKDFIVQEIVGDELKEHNQALEQYFQSMGVELFSNFDSFHIEHGTEIIQEKQFVHQAFFSNGLLLITYHELIPEADIFKRFAKVFDQTYTRFLDLQKAEQQLYRSKIENALERVRTRSLAMQKPEELKEVAAVLRSEMGKLDVEELETCSIYIIGDSIENAECWYALKDIRESGKNLVSDHFNIDLSETWVGRQMIRFHTSKEEKVSIPMIGIDRVEWIRYCEKKSTPIQGYYGEEIPERIYHLYKFSHGYMGFAAAGEISEESWDILKRSASAFSLAYSRFQDLTKARDDLDKLKEEKHRAETALTKLTATQSQLIHAEKMASLGELTAGIAHEIQNPLNFVNNFSELNDELIVEIKEELERGELKEAMAILEDLAENEQKITYHGKRAEGIVKSMLQHSRTSTGEKGMTDINVLCDEYIRLAYHGMRAKDKSFNADFELDLDSDLPKIEVVPQDIGRVLLNLINNAFHACIERSRDTQERSALSSSKGSQSVVNTKRNTRYAMRTAHSVPQNKDTDQYKPKVTVATQMQNDSILISIKDNGPGIPPEIKDKIFQPFFTTKPTGEGTGLGLSLAYDIVTKGHGGELTVSTEEGRGTEFIIILKKNDVK